MKALKVLFAASAALLLAVACQKYDDSALTGRVSALEQKVSSIESQIAALQTAINNKVTVDKVEQTATGWTIYLTDKTTIALSNGKDGKDGAPGKDGADGKDGKDGDTFFQSVTVEGGYVKIVLNDEAKTEFVLPLAKRIVIGDEAEEFIAVAYGEKTKVALKLPSDVEIATVAATVLYADGSATDIKTKGGSSAWSVEIVSDTEIEIAAGASADLKDAVLQVSAIEKDGTTTIASKLVKITGLSYAGEVYGIVKLADGNVWMAENLRYIPDGAVLGEPGDASAKIYYPYTTDGTNTSALKDEVSIEKLGLLYSGDFIFGTPIDKENVHNFEGQQGICPPGWHIPSRAEYLALCGNSNKDDGGVEKTNVIDETALFYDAGYKAGKVKSFNDAGWNLVFSGCVFNGAYNKTMISADKCIYEEWVGSCAMNYYWASTGYLGTTATAKPQFFALMTTFTSANNEGKVSLSYCNTTNAAPLRCVKDLKSADSSIVY